MVAFFQVGKCFDEHRPVVCDNLTKCTPLAQDFFEDPIFNGLHGFCMQRMVFGEMDKGAAPLNKILETS